MMQEQPNPNVTNVHITTTTTTEVNTALRYDATYAKTIPGLLKIVQIVLNLLGFICVEASIYSNYSRGEWYITVAMFGFWCTGILLVLYLFHVVEKFYKIPWLKVEFIYCGIIAICYLIAAILAADLARHSGAYAAAAVFGFCATVAYAYDCFLKYRGVQAGELAQGNRSVMKETTTTATHAY